jgi:glycosyltransferase involved in cell wall biosynthesis
VTHRRDGRHGKRRSSSKIPCFNESLTLADTIADLPKSLPGFSRVVVLVVDDGSTDDTTEVALSSGADYVVRHRRNRGLARAFTTGLTTALELGADVIVNTDADHQYPGRYVSELVEPILAGEADLVVGDRRPRANVHFSPIKRLLEAVGSWVVRHLSQTDIRDASSGFRAYSRYAALRTQAYNDYSYTLETLIQAGRDEVSRTEQHDEQRHEQPAARAGDPGDGAGNHGRAQRAGTSDSRLMLVRVPACAPSRGRSRRCARPNPKGDR